MRLVFKLLQCLLPAVRIFTDFKIVGQGVLVLSCKCPGQGSVFWTRTHLPLSVKRPASKSSHFDAWTVWIRVVNEKSASSFSTCRQQRGNGVIWEGTAFTHGGS